LARYFAQRLIGERAASPNTIASHKLTFQLLLVFASSAAKKAPSSLDIADLDAPLIASFLEHLEQGRRNSIATRDSRLAAIHSLFGYLALRHPEHAASIQRVLAVPPKRAERNLVTYLSDAAANALLSACDLTRWTGRRDHALFVLAIQTGLRICELAGLTRSDVTLTATDLPARRHEPQAAGHRTHPPARRQARPLPAHRHHARLLEGPLTMPTSSARSPPLNRHFCPTSA
jgi:integrase/recombinase XerD